MKKTVALLLAMMLILAGMTVAVTVGAEVNYPVNETFEETTDVDWATKYTGTASISHDATGGYGGTGAVKYTANAGISSDGSGTQHRFFTAPQVTFKKGATYTISFRGKASSSAAAWCAPNFGYTDETGVHHNYPANTCSFTTSWKQFSWTFSIKNFDVKNSEGVWVDSGEETKTAGSMIANFWGFSEGLQVWIDDFTITEVTDEAATIDLSATAKTVLAVNETSQIKVTAKDVFGNVIENPNVIYASGNNEVATVSDAGLVTAHKKGVAIITVQSTAAAQSIVMMVGDKGKTVSFDSAPPAAISTDAAKNTAYQYAASVDTTTYREGTGAWKIKNRTDVTGMKTDNYALVSGLQDTTAQTFAYWFYDDGSNMSKGRIHMRNGSTKYKGVLVDGNYDTGATAAERGRLSLLMYLNKDRNGTYTYQQWDNGLKNLAGSTLQSSTGWHQVVLVNTFETTTVYLDGQVWMSGDNLCPGLDIAQLDFVMQGGAAFDSVILDDFVAVDTGTTTPQHIVTVEATGEHGAVKNDQATVSPYSYVNSKGTTVKNKFNSITVYENDDLTLTMVPEEGYEAKVTVGGQKVAVQDDNTVTISNITSDTTVNVTFEKIITEPSISGTSADYIVSGEYGESKDFSYVAYYKLVLPADYQLGEYGMYFNESGATTEALKLPASQIDETANMFGIRVFGDAVQQGKTYTFQGYAELEDGEGTEGTITTETITK